MSVNNNKVVTIGSLIKKDVKDAYYLPAWPSSHTRGHYRFRNDKKYRVYDCPPPSLTFNNLSFPFRNLAAAGDEVPVLLDYQPPRYLKKHWKKWLTAFPQAKLKTVDEGLKDDALIVTTGALQSISEKKHSVDPDVLYMVQLKSVLPEIGVPCPTRMEENAVECPCIVKVDQSWSGRGTLMAKNKHELSAILKEIREENGWKEKIIFEKVIQGIKEVPSFQFHLHRSGEIYWIGTTCGGFTGYQWTSAVVDWDKHEYYKNLVWDDFTIPITKYLHKQGYFGLVTFEVIITDHGMYLCDLNPRVGGDTTHLLLAPFMAQSMGYTHSCLTLNNHFNVPPKTIIENANDLNNANVGRVIVTSAANDGNGCVCDLSIYAKTLDDLKVLYEKVTHT